MDDLSSEEKAAGVKARHQEETTARHIRRGTVIEVRASDAGPSVIALDAERTPVVVTPSVPPGYSNRPPPPWSMDVDDMTTRRWSPSLAPPPLPSPMPSLTTPRGSRMGRLADLVGLQTVAALALLVIAGLHFSERREAASHATAAAAAAAAAPDRAMDVPPPVDATEPVSEPAPEATPTAQPIEIAPITDIDFEFPADGPANDVAASKHPAPADALTLGHEALMRGHFDQARAAYAGLMAREPRNVEAIAGLADVARARGEISYAAELYNRAIEVVPTYLPAQVGLADALWDTGDRSRSVARYRAIVDGFARVPPLRRGPRTERNDFGAIPVSRAVVRFIAAAGLSLVGILGAQAPAWACATSADCSGATPICDATTHLCRACGSGTDCTALLDLPICVEVGLLGGPPAGSCVACVQGTNCSGATPVCAVSIGLCLGCLLDSDCGNSTSGMVCGPGAKCEAGCRGTGNQCPSGETCSSGALGLGIGQCVSSDGGVKDAGVDAGPVTCSTSANCPATAPICDATSHTCRGCNSGTDCTLLVDTPVCVTASLPNGPVAGECVACVSTTDCKSNQVCDVSIGLCLGCVLDSDCGGASSGLVCNNSTGTCESGCRGTGNHCPSGETCTSTGLGIGQCVAGDGGSVDGGGGDGGSTGDGGTAGDGGGAGDAGSGDGGEQGDATVPGDGSVSSDGGNDEDATVNPNGDDGGDGTSNGDGSTTGGGNGLVGGFVAGGGCSCSMHPGGSQDFAGLVGGALALLIATRRRGKKEGRSLK